MLSLRPLLIVAACLAVSAPAMAQSCPGSITRVSNVTGLVGGNTVCAVRGGDSWQEFHSGNNSGPLIDYKRGPGHPIDPTKNVGTWSASNGANGGVTYSYTGGSSFTYIVCDAGGSNYTFVSNTAGTITGARFRTGQVACTP